MVQHRERWMRTAWEIDYVQSSIKDARRSGAKMGHDEVSDLLERAHVQLDIHFTAWEDFAITAMVERGLGVSILPGLILQRIPYKIEIRSCSSPITTQSALL